MPSLATRAPSAPPSTVEVERMLSWPSAFAAAITLASAGAISSAPAPASGQSRTAAHSAAILTSILEPSHGAALRRPPVPAFFRQHAPRIHPHFLAGALSRWKVERCPQVLS